MFLYLLLESLMRLYHNFQLSIFNFQFSVSQIFSFSDLKKSPRGIYFVSLLSSLRSARAQLLNAARLFCLRQFMD